METRPSILTLEGLSFTYPEGDSPVLRSVDLEVPKGQFATLCGPSGCGKTTLLRHLKSVLAPHGKREGRVLFDGTPLEELDLREQSRRIGFVLQSPDQQIVTDKVWHELAFGLESLGCDTPTIRLRVAEMASFFGIETWFHKDVSQLSGGQKQLLNLAAVMAMGPELLILDEPTSQLDPIAAADFLATVAKLNRELGTTVLLTEHRLEEALPHSHRLIVMDQGEIIADGAPSQAGQALRDRGHRMFLAMPAPMRIYAGVKNDLACPVTVREGRDWLESYAAQNPVVQVPARPDTAPDNPPIIQAKEVWFRYEEDSPDVVRGLDLSVPAGAFYALVGGNGTGKSTTLTLLSGIYRPDRGEIRLDGRPIADISDEEKFGGLLGVLPQNPQALFVKKTVEEDLWEVLEGRDISREAGAAKVAALAELCELGPLLDRHPYDLSGGEQQRAALAKVLLLEPRVLLLDEPTKGLDGHFKAKLAHILLRLRGAGTTIFMVSHDVEFCAKYADRCALFFDGAVVTEGIPQTFFAGNSFYTTAANRMARHILPGAVTAEDVILACGGEVEEPDLAPAPLYRVKAKAAREKKEKPLPAWRKGCGLALALIALVLAVCIIRSPGLPAGGLAGRLIGTALLPSLCALGAAVLLTKRDREARLEAPVKKKLARRTVLTAAAVLVLVPLTLFIGSFYLSGRKYAFISLLIVVETMLPFFLVFEGRKPQARELVLIATLCAVAVAGRSAFFFLPQFKPVAAIIILAGVAFGGETGFLVGAVTMLCSNMFFGQGPWTPFQMFAMGLIGFLAGVLFRKGLLGRSRAALCVYGGVSVFFLYGFIMNTYNLFQTQAVISLPMLMTSIAVAIPMDLVHALSTVLFLWVAGPAFLEKLDRVKVKYGLMD